VPANAHATRTLKSLDLWVDPPPPRRDGTGRLRLDPATLDRLIHARVGHAVDVAMQTGLDRALCKLTGRVD
jgi:hypothetical protein